MSMTPPQNNDPKDSPSQTSTSATTGDPKKARALLQIEDDFYQVIAGGTKIAMLLTLLDSGMAQLLFERGPLTEDEILDALGLHRGRGHKFLLLAESVGMLVIEPGQGPGPQRFRAPDVVRALVDPAAPNHFFYRDFLRFWRVAAAKDHVALLRGAEVPDPVRYPPVLWEDVLLLHDWMRDGALVTLSAIERCVDIKKGGYRRILDVAGGDATMAIALARRHPEITITVFNLPAAAELCRRNIAAAKLGDRIQVVEGDFRVDSFPVISGGFDLTIFSRVMADWDPEVCRMLMQKTHAALRAGGHLLIAEPLRDDNPDLGQVWEHCYLPYDDFGAAVYKRRATYEALLRETGFRLLEAHGRRDTIHSVLLSERLPG